MFGTVVAVGVALVAAFATFTVTSQMQVQRAYEDSLANLDAAINGSAYAPASVAWYAEPVNASLVVGAIVLVVGFMLASSSNKAH